MVTSVNGRAARSVAAAVVAAVACLLVVKAGPAAVLRAAQTAPGTTPAQPPAAGDQPVFRSGVKLVLVDVSVTGNDEAPITDLGPDDFELTEDGLPQKVEQATLVQIDGQPRGNGEALPIRSQDHAVAEAGRDDVRVFAVFMDDYHLGRYPQEMLPLRKALTEFIGNMMGPLDLVTVMNPITPLSALKWTRDRDALVRDLKAYEGRIDNFIGRSALEESQNLTRNVLRVRSQVVISALQALVMHLSGLREGRKTLVVVSRGIPLLFDISLEQDFQALLREANRGNVMIHTLDPRGLGQGIFVHDTLHRLAAETGGQAIVNTNDLAKGLGRVIRDASHHYLIGYAPARELNDGKFHRIAVKVTRRGARTVARRGYWSPTAAEMTPAVTPTLEPGVRGALTSLQARQDDRVAHVSTGFSPGPNGTVRLTAVWKPVPGFKERPDQLRIEARTEGGPSLGTAEAALGAEGSGVVSLDVPAGDLLVRFSVAAAGGEVVDRWEVPMAVPDLSGTTLAVATPVFLRGRTTAAFQALRRGEAGTPSPDREFRTTDLVVVRAEVADAGAEPPPRVTAEVLTRQGKLLASLPATFAGGRHQIDLPLRSLALGEYVLRFTATRGDGSAATTAAFAIIR
jgi:VWFA-related protein